MPRMDGLQVLEELQKSKSTVKAIIVSQFDKPETIARCMDLGACGFLSTYVVDDEEQTAIDSVLNTGSYINFQTNRALLKEIARLRRFEPHLYDNCLHFNRDEMEVLKAYACQFSNDEIADQVCVSPKKVERIKREMVNALGLDNIFSVFIYACQKGIINLDEVKLRARTTSLSN
jgi:DNA-binding NarL/FixJ family response regulator